MDHTKDQTIDQTIDLDDLEIVEIERPKKQSTKSYIDKQNELYDQKLKQHHIVSSIRQEQAIQLKHATKKEFFECMCPGYKRIERRKNRTDVFYCKDIRKNIKIDKDNNKTVEFKQKKCRDCKFYEKLLRRLRRENEEYLKEYLGEEIGKQVKALTWEKIEEMVKEANLERALKIIRMLRAKAKTKEIERTQQKFEIEKFKERLRNGELR